MNWLIASLTEYSYEHNDVLTVAVKEISKLQKYESLVNDTIIPFVRTILHPGLKVNYFKEHYSRNPVRDITKKILSYFETVPRQLPKPQNENWTLPLAESDVDLVEYWKARNMNFRV